MEKNEMGEACSTYGGKEKYLKWFDGRIIIKWICKTWDGNPRTGLLWLKIVLCYGRYGTTYRSHLQGSSSFALVVGYRPLSLKRCLTLADRTDRQPRNFGNQPPTYVAKYPKRTKAAGV
jgi:hypothetical protein